MKKQPDFRQLFNEHYGSGPSPSKITYQIRDDSNRFHDLTFLNSFIHDARFHRKDVALRGERLSISLVRDCWELGFTEHPDSVELHVAKARLTIFPVLDLEWRFNYSDIADDELWIGHLWIDRRGENLLDDTTPVIFRGFDWQCVLHVRESDMKIRLQDLETPYLFSARE